MKKNLLNATFLFLLFVSLTGCATISGGSTYHANVTVINHPNAEIKYKGQVRGKGFASISVPRKDAGNFTIVVKDENFEEQTFNFTQKSFRGWAFVGTCLWIGVYQGVPLPWGPVIDLVSGALWKPNITERGVTKSDIKNYNYSLEYTGKKENNNTNNTNITNTNITLVPQQIQSNLTTKNGKLRDLKQLLDEKIITQQEFEKEKAKILEDTKE